MHHEHVFVMNQIAASDRVPATIVCIKWGNKFPAYYVNRLYAGVKRFMDRPFRFVCYTENPVGIRAEVEVFELPVVPFESRMVEAMTTGKRRGAWRKVTILQPGEAGLSGPCMVMDLDVVVSGPLGPLFDHVPGKICMGRDWLERRRGNIGGHGSVYRFDPALHPFLLGDFASNIEAALKWKGEQRYISMTAHSHGVLEYFPDGWICSYKRQAIAWPPLNFFSVPRLPDDCRVMCFHGTPKMEEALTGDCPKWQYRTRPAPWLRELWLDEGEKDWLPV